MRKTHTHMVPFRTLLPLPTKHYSIRIDNEKAIYEDNSLASTKKLWSSHVSNMIKVYICTQFVSANKNAIRGYLVEVRQQKLTFCFFLYAQNTTHCLFFAHENMSTADALSLKDGSCYYIQDS